VTYLTAGTKCEPPLRGSNPANQSKQLSSTAKAKTITIKAERLSSTAKLPTKAYEGDAGFDLYSDQKIRVTGHTKQRISTGVRLAIPDDYCLVVKDRGSTPELGLTHAAGVIDQGFRGELFITLVNFTPWPVDLAVGDKLLQFLVLPVPRVKLVEVTETETINTNTERGEKKLASSGA
tara:strand:- start:1246 stop:1779 length:534 start_codon:yes stop_codon:yes gene_type:complete